MKRAREGRIRHPATTRKDEEGLRQPGRGADRGKTSDRLTVTLTYDGAPCLCHVGVEMGKCVCVGGG